MSEDNCTASPSNLVSEAPAPSSKAFAPALSAAFRDRIRPVLNSIDRLRSHGLQTELRLPTVAVVGDQSVGKSSVLEAISGVDLPRGSGIVTRCPLQLSMRCRPDGKWRGHISYDDSKDRRVEFDIPDKSQVGKFIHEAQNAITGCATGVSNQQIDLTIESADVSDLTLIDLPGIARFSETHANISKTTKDLIKSYISQDQVIILVVVPCEVDIETVEAIALAKDMDPQGARTIGVMTRPDLTNPGSEDDVIATLNNMGTVKLKKGFVMVRCRTPLELKQNIGLSDAAKAEAEFFAGHPHFSQVPKDLVGTQTLAERLTDELFKAVALGIEGLEQSLKTKLNEYEVELKALGDSQCDSEDEKRLYLARKLQQFLARVGAATASTTADDSAIRGSASRLYANCLDACTRFGLNMDQSKPGWITKYATGVPADVIDEVRNLRGRELPTFTFVFPVVHRIVREVYLPQATEHSHQLLESVRALVVKALGAVTSDLFQAFPRLRAAVMEAVASVTEAKEAECRADLRKLMSQHESRVFTQDARFSAEQDVMAQRQRETLLAAAARGHRGFSSPQDSQVSPETAIAERVRLGAGAYLSIACHRISDTVPMSVLSHMLDGVAAALSDEVTRAFASSATMDMLQEQPSRKRRRQHLTKAVKQMTESHADMRRAKQSRLEF